MKTTCGIYTHYFKDFKWMSAIDGGRIRRQYVLEEELRRYWTSKADLNFQRDTGSAQLVLLLHSVWR